MFLCMGYSKALQLRICVENLEIFQYLYYIKLSGLKGDNSTQGYMNVILLSYLLVVVVF